MRRILVVGVAAIAVTAIVASAVVAGGSWIAPTRDRYEPGDSVEMVGYFGTAGELDPAVRFFAYLRLDASADRGASTVDGWPSIRQTDLPLGELVITPFSPGRARAAITFTLPDDLAPAQYPIVYCNDPCTHGVGDLVGGTIHVSVDPAVPLRREWPQTEPAIAHLPDDAIVSGPSGTYTAGELRADPALRTFPDPGPAQPRTEGPPRPAPPPPATWSTGSFTGAQADPTPATPIRTPTNGRSSPAPLITFLVGAVAVVAAFTVIARRRRADVSPADDPVRALEPQPPTPDAIRR